MNYEDDVRGFQLTERKYRENAQGGMVKFETMTEVEGKSVIGEMLAGLDDMAKAINLMFPDFGPHRELEHVDATRFSDGSTWITFSRGNQERGFHIYAPNAARELKMSFTSRNTATNQAVSLYWTKTNDLYSCASGDGAPSLYGRHMMKQ